MGDSNARTMAASPSSSSLPEAPEAAVSASAGGGSQNAGAVPAAAGVYDKYILPGQSVPKINGHDKFILGVRDAFSPLAVAGWIASAGYEQVFNQSPNYGQTGKGFAQRLGASAARDVTEGIFSDSIMAPLLREDPRYYKLGRGHNVVHRLLYAGTRELITRTDGGRQTVNLALLSGNLGGAVLTNAYYPENNRGFQETAKTFGGSIGGSALGFVVSEFLSDTLSFVHIKQD